jgi:HEAT repeat protein
LGWFSEEAREAVPALSVALTDFAAGHEAAVALARIGPPAKAAIPGLVEMANSSDPWEAGHAQYALWKLDPGGGHPMDAGITVLVDAYDAKRGGSAWTNTTSYGGIHPEEALAILGQIGPPANAAVPTLLKSLGRPPRGRDAVVEALKKIEPDRTAKLGDKWPYEYAVRAAIEGLRDKDHRERYRAAGALGALPLDADRDAAVEALAKSLSDENLRVRVRAAWSLSFLDQQQAMAGIPSLLKALRSRDSQLRMTSSAALSNLGNNAKSAVPALLEMLKVKNERLRQIAAELLRRIDPASAPKPERKAAQPRNNRSRPIRW